MNHRTAKKVLQSLESRSLKILHNEGTIREALGVMSRYPSEVERISCNEHSRRLWGVDYRVKPALVRKRFGDGRYWGVLSPINTRPNYYIIMGDSSWADDDNFREELEFTIYDTIGEQFGRDDFYCEECGRENWEEPNECCSDERGWPALDTEGSSWGFPCYESKLYIRRWRIDFKRRNNT